VDHNVRVSNHGNPDRIPVNFNLAGGWGNMRPKALASDSRAHMPTYRPALPAKETPPPGSLDLTAKN
jgi:hypothetical protein